MAASRIRSRGCARVGLLALSPASPSRRRRRPCRSTRPRPTRTRWWASSPTFSWEGRSIGPTRYEVIAELPGGDVKVAETATGGATKPPQPSRCPTTGGAVVREGRRGPRRRDAHGNPQVRPVATSPGPPAVTASPPAIGRNPSPVFAWSGNRVSSRWSILNAPAWRCRAARCGPRAARWPPRRCRTAATSSGWRSGTWWSVEGPPAAAGFSVDTVAPGPLTLRRSTARPDSRNRPPTRGGPRAGCRRPWRCCGRAAPTSRARQRPRGQARWRAQPGSYVFEGAPPTSPATAGPLATDAFVVLPRLAAGVRLPMRQRQRLTPAVGATVPAVRPTLRWTAGPKGTRIYNVQVFRVTKKAKLREVLSAFPAPAALRRPRRKALARGQCYVWRVWPFRGSGPRRAPRREPLLRAPEVGHRSPSAGAPPIGRSRTGRTGSRRACENLYRGNRLRDHRAREIPIHPAIHDCSRCGRGVCSPWRRPHGATAPAVSTSTGPPPTRHRSPSRGGRRARPGVRVRPLPGRPGRRERGPGRRPGVGGRAPGGGRPHLPRPGVERGGPLPLEIPGPRHGDVIIDRTAPGAGSGFRRPRPTATTAGTEASPWFWTCGDGGSGVASCPADEAVNHQGAGQAARAGPATARATSAPSNVAGVQLRRLAPSTGSMLTPSPGATSPPSRPSPGAKRPAARRPASTAMRSWSGSGAPTGPSRAWHGAPGPAPVRVRP